MIEHGWIDEVEDGIVYGRFEDGTKAFEIPVLSVLEDQRVDLEPGRYVSFPNGHMLIDKTIRTTHDIELSQRWARKVYQRLNFGPDLP